MRERLRLLTLIRKSHSAILGSRAACAYPRLIAACHGLPQRPSLAIPQAALALSDLTRNLGPDSVRTPLFSLYDLFLFGGMYAWQVIVGTSAMLIPTVPFTREKCSPPLLPSCISVNRHCSQESIHRLLGLSAANQE